MLTVHQRGWLLSASSTVITYAIAIPFAAVGVFALHSPVAAVASCVFVATALALYVSRRALRRDHWKPLLETQRIAEVRIV
jgi:uncharacterized membrane protein